MTIEPLDDAGTKPDATSILATLAAAIGDGAVPTTARVCAADPRSPEEGLALLGAYVAITDRHVRQAILDALLLMAARTREPPAA